MVKRAGVAQSWNGYSSRKHCGLGVRASVKLVAAVSQYITVKITLWNIAMATAREPWAADPQAPTASAAF